MSRSFRVTIFSFVKFHKTKIFNEKFGNYSIIIYSEVGNSILILFFDLANTMYALEVLLTRLKPKGVKDAVKQRMNAIM